MNDVEIVHDESHGPQTLRFLGLLGGPQYLSAACRSLSTCQICVVSNNCHRLGDVVISCCGGKDMCRCWRRRCSYIADGTSQKEVLGFFLLGPPYLPLVHASVLRNLVVIMHWR